MLFQNIFGLAIFFLGFMYLRQITTWTLNSFRNGIVVYRSEESFPLRFPLAALNREISIKNIIFKFISPNTGLVKAHPLMSWFKNRIRNYFPSLLGEIKLDRNGYAQITLRIPLPIIIISLAAFIAVVNWSIEGVPTINSLFVALAKGIFVMAIFSALAYFDFVREKEHLYEGFALLKERIESGTLD